MPPPVVLLGNDIHGPLCEMGAHYSAAVANAFKLPASRTVSLQSHQDLRPEFKGTVIRRRGGRLIQLFKLYLALARIPKPESKIVHFIGNGNAVLNRSLTAFAALTGRRCVFSPFGKILPPRSADAVVCLDDSLRRHFEPTLPLGSIHTVPPIASISAPFEKRDWGAGRLLFCSVPVKVSELAERGVPFLLDALFHAQHHGIECSLLILNRYAHMTEPLSALIRASNARNVELRTEIVSNMQTELRETSVLIVPYRSEQLAQVPQSAVEALACGVPCLVPKFLALAKALQRTGAGAHFEDTASFVTALSFIRARYPAVSDAARRLFDDEFEPSQALESLQAVYRGLL